MYAFEIFLINSSLCSNCIFNRSLLLVLLTHLGRYGSHPTPTPPFGESLFHVWRDVFTGGFGPTNIPHLILSQFSPIIPHAILQGVYLFFLFFSSL